MSIQKNEVEVSEGKITTEEEKRYKNERRIACSNLVISVVTLIITSVILIWGFILDSKIKNIDLAGKRNECHSKVLVQSNSLIKKSESFKEFYYYCLKTQKKCEAMKEKIADFSNAKAAYDNYFRDFGCKSNRKRAYDNLSNLIINLELGNLSAGGFKSVEQGILNIPILDETTCSCTSDN